MDLLCAAYDGEGEDDDIACATPKRSRSEAFCQPMRPTPAILYHRHPSCAPIEAHVADVTSRYVSKRERAILGAASSRVPDPTHPQSTPELDLAPPMVVTSHVVGSLSDSDISHDRVQKEYLHSQSNKIPRRSSVVLNGHTKAVNCVQWSKNHGHLLASAGMDEVVYVWNVWSSVQQKSHVFRYHNAAVKDVRWSPQGLSLLSCGYDCSSRLVDIEKGVETQVFNEDQVVGVIRFHPRNSNLFLSGGAKGFLRLWDIRIGKTVQEYLRDLGPILDIEFRGDGKHFVSSSDTSRSNISENSIVVWDVSRQLPLSNQVYMEAYTCPSIRYHPWDACFVAQSNGNYIAIFSSKPPFKMDRYKRYEKHGVWGFPIKCSFSLDGKELASGSSDGSLYFYDYRSSELLRKMKAFEEVCVDVEYHPTLANVVAACSWSGEVCVFC